MSVRWDYSKISYHLDFPRIGFTENFLPHVEMVFLAKVLIPVKPMREPQNFISLLDSEFRKTFPYFGCLERRRAHFTVEVKIHKIILIRDILYVKTFLLLVEDFDNLKLCREAWIEDRLASSQVTTLITSCHCFLFVSCQFHSPTINIKLETVPIEPIPL